MAAKAKKAKKAKKAMKARQATTDTEATAATVASEGRLTRQVLRQKLRRGKGPVIHLGGAFSSKARDSQEIRRGLR